MKIVLSLELEPTKVDQDLWAKPKQQMPNKIKDLNRIQSLLK